MTGDGEDMAIDETRIVESFTSCSDISNISEEEGESSGLIEPYGVGVDTHSKFIQVCVFVHVGNRVLRYEREATTDWTDLVRAKDWVLEVINQHHVCASFHYTIESTGNYHMPVLKAFGGTPRVINPMLAGQTKRKTDVLDARLLAHHDITGLWNDSYIYSDESEVLRALAALSLSFQRRKTQCSNRIGGFLLRFGHTVTSYAKIGSAFTDAIIEDLIQGKLSDAPGVRTQNLPVPARQILAEYVREWQHAKTQERYWHKRALAYAKEMEFVLGTGEVTSGADLHRLLMTVPGVGEKTALVWMTEVVETQRFANAKACAAYCGLDPTLKVSAGKVTSYSRRMGNTRLHRAFIQGAGALISRKREPFGQWGYRMMKAKAKGGYKKACGAVARRMAVACYHVQRTGEAFDYKRYDFWRRKEVPDMPLEQMGLGRYEALLRRLGFERSQEVIDAYYTTLAAEKGVGEKCLQTLRKWLSENTKASSSRAPSSDARVRASATRLVRGLRTASSATTGSST